MSGRAREALVGVGLLVVVLAILFAAVGRYANLFSPGAPVTLLTERVGLNLLPGAKVKFRGVPVGRVEDVRTTGGGAVLDLRIDPDELKIIPSDVRADIAPTTVFGAKFVELTPPARPSTGHLAAGATLDNRSVTTEVNSVFAQLMDVFAAVPPAKLNLTLGALAQSLAGRGAQLGNTATELNTYLAGINPSVPLLRHDLAATATVADLYADVTPDLVSALDNLAVTGDTLVARRDDLRALLPALADTGHSGRRFFDESDQLDHALSLLHPTTELLRHYSSGLTCFVQGLDNSRKLLEPVIGGNDPNLNLNVSFLPAPAPYSPLRDLPKIGADNPPACHGLPLLRPSQVPAPYVHTDTGVRVNPRSDNKPVITSPPLVVQLFGAGAAPTRSGGTR